MSHARDFLNASFPELVGRLAPLAEVALPFAGGVVLAFTDLAPPPDVSMLFGGLDAMPPPSASGSYAILGILAKGGCEDLVALWAEGDRRFCFRERLSNPFASTAERARAALRRALARWEAGARLVGTSAGLMYDATSGRWCGDVE